MHQFPDIGLDPLNWAHDELRGLNAPKIELPHTPASVEGLCPRDGSACESAGDGTRCCAERHPFTTDPRLIGE